MDKDKYHGFYADIEHCVAAQTKEIKDFMMDTACMWYWADQYACVLMYMGEFLRSVDEPVKVNVFPFKKGSKYVAKLAYQALDQDDKCHEQAESVGIKCRVDDPEEQCEMAKDECYLLETYLIKDIFYESVIERIKKNICGWKIIQKTVSERLLRQMLSGKLVRKGMVNDLVRRPSELLDTGYATEEAYKPNSPQAEKPTGLDPEPEPEKGQ